MIAALAKLAGLDKLLVVAALVVALAIGAWCLHGAIYGSGYQAAAQRYEAILSRERADAAEASANEQRRQTIANNAAKQREAEAVAQLEAEQTENVELRRKLASEAQQDPDADKPVLGSGSVQRINKVR